MIRTYDYKLYPSREQATCLERWLSVCCWLYNQMLEHRIKAYQRRRESPSLNRQCLLLTGMRSRSALIRGVPVEFARDAIRRVDLGMQAFFRRLQSGERPGFPRFKSIRRFQSIRCLKSNRYLRGSVVHIPGLGTVRCRGRVLPEGEQKSLRIVHRSTGWYVQVVLDDGVESPAKSEGESIGIDVGLEHFATTSDGRHISNPRFGEKSARKVRSLNRKLARCRKGSNRRRRAVKRLVRQHEQIADQRRAFCHSHSTDLTRRYALIAVEKLNVGGMARGRFAKSIMDAAWGTFTTQLSRKAEDAGVRVVFVNPRGTSQECPDCGRVKKKSLSERVHSCECGLRCQRDHAAARVILAHALGLAGATRTSTDSTADALQCAASSSGPAEA